MNLTVKDRIVMSQLYPKQGNLISQVLVRDINKKIMLEQDEIKDIDFQVREDGRSYIWNEKKAKDKDVDFTEAEIDLLKKEVENLDKDNKITQDVLDVCLKIKG